MGTCSREYELYEEDLIEMFKLCTGEEIDKLEVWFNKQSGRWNLHAVISEDK